LTSSEPRRDIDVSTNPSETPLIVEGKLYQQTPQSPDCISNIRWDDGYAQHDLSTAGPGTCTWLDFRHGNNTMNILYYDGSVRAVTFYQAQEQISECRWDGEQFTKGSVPCPLANGKEGQD
jgi:prepilin-type processing-associated H-X9-DG protein